MGAMVHATVLVVSGDDELARGLAELLTGEGFAVDVRRSAADAIDVARSAEYDLTVLDAELLEMPCTALLTALKAARPATEYLLVTPHDSTEDAVAAVRSRAASCLLKPVRPLELIAEAARLVEAKRLREDHRRTQSDLARLSKTLDALVNSVESGIVLIGPDGNVEFANRYAGELLQVPPERMVGASAAQLTRDALSSLGVGRERVERILASRASTDPSEHELEARIPSRRVLRCRSIPLQPSPEAPVGRLEVYRDITTEREELEREQYVARTLQDSLLPDIPRHLDGLQFATLYHAAGQTERVGGDFFDVFAAEGGRIAAVIGDMSGKGIEAAVDIARTRYAIRCYALEDPSPASVVTRLNRFANSQGECGSFVTVAYALIDPDAHRLTYTTAGHEPLMLSCPENSAVRLLSVGGPVVGGGYRGGYEQEEVSWVKGCVLFLYADGITEARRNGQFLGAHRVLEMFRRHLAAGGTKAIARRIYRDLLAFSGGALKDDVAMLLVRALR